MDELTAQLEWFQNTARRPDKALKAWTAQGGRAVGCLPYYAPEELVWAAGMLPMALWGGSLRAERAEGWFQPYLCSLVQTQLELALRGSLEGLSAVMGAPLCDTLRSLSQNWQAAVPRIPFLAFSQPQNRNTTAGRRFLAGEYEELFEKLCQLSGETPSEARLWTAIHLYNESRAQRRRFVGLAACHEREILPSVRCAVLKAAGFAAPEEYVKHLTRLNDRLEACPKQQGRRIGVLTSGILCDHPRVLQLLDEYGFAVRADDVAAESRGFGTDVPEGGEDPFLAMAERFGRLDGDTLLSCGGSTAIAVGDTREARLVKLARESGAEAVLFLQQQFCDPEELLTPCAKQALEQAGIPCLILPTDQQVREPGQSATLLETLADLLR